MSTEIRIREAGTEDEEEILELLRGALGVTPVAPFTPEVWRWKHVENPFGASPVLLAYLQGELVGVRAYLRWSFVTPEGGPIQAARAVDTATHPDHHRRGIFRTLTLEANRRLEAAGYDLIFNTPNEKSLPGYLSMGWRRVGVPLLHARLLRPFPLGMRNRPRSDDGDPVLTVGHEVSLEAGCLDRSPRGFRTQRSADYLRWRFGSHPTVRYYWSGGDDALLIGRANVRFGRWELLLSEVLGSAREAGRSLGEWLAASGADYAVAAARFDSPEAGVLRRQLFLPVPRVGSTLVALPLSTAARPALSLRGWDLSLGDLELM